MISFLLEALYGSRFWDYSQFPFNLNGRICITYTIYWAILSLILMKIIKPSTAKAIKIIPKRVGKIAGIILNKIPINAKKYMETYYYSNSSNVPVAVKKNTQVRENINNQKTNYVFENNNNISSERTQEIIDELNKYLKK